MNVIKKNYLFLFLLLLLLQTGVNAQLKSFKISAKGDTINKIDKKNRMQGKWVIKKIGRAHV